MNGFLSSLTRRGFIATAAAGAAGACIASPHVCNAEETKTALPEPHEVLDADIVVLGAGSGGMACAIQAAELGLKAVLLEKNAVIGGTSAFAEGMFALNSHIQLENDVVYDNAEILQRVMEYHCWMADAELTKDFFDASGETIAWLESHNASFDGVETLGPSLRSWHTYTGMGTQFTQGLWDECLAMGVDCRTETPGVELVVEEGHVCGVVAQQSDGQTVRINARGVVLATGGYSNSAEMIDTYSMFDSQTMTYIGEPLTGFFAEFDEQRKAGNPYIHVCDTLEELADETGMDPEVLTATIEHYNELCAAGVNTLQRPHRMGLAIAV